MTSNAPAWVRNNPMHNTSFLPPDPIFARSESLSTDELGDLVRRLAEDDRTLLPVRRLLRANKVVPKYLIPLLRNIPNPGEEKIEKASLAIQLLAELTTPLEFISPEAGLNPYCRAEVEKLLKDTQQQIFMEGLLADLHRQISSWIRVKDCYSVTGTSQFIKNYLILCRNLLSIKDDAQRANGCDERSRLFAVTSIDICVSSKNILNEMLVTGFLELFASLCLLDAELELVSWSPFLSQLLVLLCKDCHPGTLVSLVQDLTVVTQLPFPKTSETAIQDAGFSCENWLVPKPKVPLKRTNEEAPNEQQLYLAVGIRRILESGAYNQLLTAFQTHLLADKDMLDLSCFLWMIAYFSKFISTDGNLQLENFSVVLSPEIMASLVFIALDSFEKTKTEKDNLIFPRRLQLVIKSIQGLLCQLERLCQSCQNPLAIGFLSQVQAFLCNVTDFRCLTFLLLREYDPETSNVAFLAEIMVTNYLTLKLLTRVASYENDDYLAHFLQRHLDKKIVLACGALLENIGQIRNAAQEALRFFVEMCLRRVHCFSLLFQAPMLPIYINLWNDRNTSLLGEKWIALLNDLSAEFLVYAQNESSADPSLLLDNSDALKDSSSLAPVVEHDDRSSDMDSRVNCEMDTNSWETDSRYSSWDGSSIDDMTPRSPRGVYLRSLEQRRKRLAREVTSKSLSDLVTLLVDRGNSQQVQWLQRQLLDLCALKYFAGKCPCTGISRFYSLNNQAVPLIPYAQAQSKALKNSMFTYLLQRMGIRPAIETGTLFPRIPEFWSASFLLFSARLLGELPCNEELLFDPACIGQDDLCGSMTMSENLSYKKAQNFLNPAANGESVKTHI